MSPDGRKVDARVTFFHPCDLKTVKALYIGAQFELEQKNQILRFVQGVPKKITLLKFLRTSYS